MDVSLAISTGTLDLVAREKRQRDDALARYFAYRIQIYLTEHPKTNRVQLARMMGIDKSVLTQLASGHNGSHERVAAVARILLPISEDEFKQLARSWAEQYPTWKPGHPLPDPITHTGDPLHGGAVGELGLYDEELRVAARAVIEMTGCSPDHARSAASLVADQHRGQKLDRWEWLQLLRLKIRILQEGSGERPSARVQLKKVT